MVVALMHRETATSRMMRMMTKRRKMRNLTIGVKVSWNSQMAGVYTLSCPCLLSPFYVRQEVLLCGYVPTVALVYDTYVLLAWSVPDTSELQVCQYIMP
jgi:hypothetical protein